MWHFTSKIKGGRDKIEVTRGQFHQRSTHSFYVRKLCAQLFCAYIFSLYFTSVSLMAQKLRIKRWWNWAQVEKKKKWGKRLYKMCDVINVSDVTKTSIKVSRKRVGKMRGILTLKKCTFIKIWCLEQNNCYEQGFSTGVSFNFSGCAAESFMS